MFFVCATFPFPLKKIKMKEGGYSNQITNIYTRKIFAKHTL